MHDRPRLQLRRAARLIQCGGVVAYPTEAVFGLGCAPACQDAVNRIIDLKRRGQQSGLILIGSGPEQLSAWIAPSTDERERLLTTHGVTTWIVTAGPHTPRWITGGRSTVAVRITRHALAAALCDAAGTAIVSTSANRHGCPPARSARAVRYRFGGRIDYILPGATGPQTNPSEIRDARTGAVLRPA